MSILSKINLILAIVAISVTFCQFFIDSIELPVYFIYSLMGLTFLFNGIESYK